MKIYTRTGDKGETSLLGGERVPKHHLRIDALGTVDELNSHIGYIRAINTDPEVEKVLERLQPLLHVLCGDIAAPLDKTGEEKTGIRRIESGEVSALEEEIDRFDSDLPFLSHFILPGGSPSGAAIHIARSVCRRAERRLVELNEIHGGVNPEAIRFINRLSDHLFTFARWANFRAGKEDIPWTGKKQAE